MSRVAKKPITLPKRVELSVANGTVTVKGPKGTLTTHELPGVSFQQENGVATVVLADGADDKFGGTARAIVANMVHGVANGFEKKLELVGVGFRAAVQGKVLNLTLGFSHPVNVPIPEGISMETPSQTEVIIKGIDRQKVG
jgi:large subunit ribosomal protein L6